MKPIRCAVNWSLVMTGPLWMFYWMIWDEYQADKAKLRGKLKGDDWLWK